MKTVNLGPIGNRSGVLIEKDLYQAGLLDLTGNDNTPAFGPDDIGLGLTWIEQDDGQTLEEATLYINVDDAADEAQVISIADGQPVLHDFMLQPRDDVEILIDVLAEELLIDKDNLKQKFLDRKAIAPRKFPQGS